MAHLAALAFKGPKARLVLQQAPCRFLARKPPRFKSPPIDFDLRKGSVLVSNKQSDLEISVLVLRRQAEDLMRILNVSQFDLAIHLCSEVDMRLYHQKAFGTHESTDIISLRAQEFTAPEVFCSRQKKLIKLGDIIICPSYVNRIFLEEQEPEESDPNKFEESDDDEEEDSGVSLAMSSMTDCRDRISVLMIHGLLHILGYDHESDDEWKTMTDRENEILKEFTKQESWAMRRENDAIITMARDHNNFF